MFMITGLQMQAYRATSDAKYSNLAASTMVDYLNRLQQSDGTFYHHENVLTYLVNAGSKLYDSEQDYTGLGAIHPNSPYAIYISTTTDPRDDTKTFRYHEIWRGTTCDEGATFTWLESADGRRWTSGRPSSCFASLRSIRLMASGCGR